MKRKLIADSLVEPKSLDIKKTFLIGLMGIENNVGVTHTSIMLADFLKTSGKVCIAEFATNSAFREIESIIHGKDLEDDRFNLFGISYFKKRDGIKVIDIKGLAYDFAVFDFGCVDTSEYFQDFLSCDIQFIVAAGAEWKINKLKDFYKSQTHRFKDRWRYLIPFSDKTIKDISKLLPNRVYRIPYQPDAFDAASKETKRILKDAISQGGK